MDLWKKIQCWFSKLFKATRPDDGGCQPPSMSGIQYPEIKLEKESDAEGGGKLVEEGESEKGDELEEAGESEQGDELEKDDESELGGESEDEGVDKPKPGRDKPINRGGRRSGEKNENSRVTVSDNDAPEPKSEKYVLICREIEGRWDIFLKLSFHQGETKFYQNDQLLSFNGNECRLSDFSEDITCAGGESVSLFDGKHPLIFRFSKDWRGEGTLVRQVTKKRHYIVITPKEWKRIGKPPVSSESCGDKKFQAHYFPAEGEDGFEGHDIRISDRFALCGKVIYDNSTKGELFTGEIPLLSDRENWKNISWMRVGEEGGGKWHEDYRPQEKNLSEVMNGRVGWFYIRIYDEDVKLLDSWDFRYAPWLDHILVNDENHSSETLIVPLVKGHATTRISFVNTDGDSVRPKSHDENSLISVNDDGVVEIAPHPAGDFIRCTLAESRGEVDIDIAVPRIWWRIGDGESGEWGDKPLTMTHEEFYNRRHETVEMLLPTGIKKVYAGFNDNTKEPFIPHRYASRVDCVKVGFKISYFAYHSVIEKPSSAKTELRIKCCATLFTVIHIPGKAENRRNKRFSVAEICEAELTVAQARKLDIRIDKRRKTLYDSNITRLEKIKENRRG